MGAICVVAFPGIAESHVFLTDISVNIVVSV